MSDIEKAGPTPAGSGSALDSGPGDNKKTEKKASAQEPPQQRDEAHLVKWEQDDPENPMNWSNAYKGWLLIQMSLLAFVGSFGSSVTAPAEPLLMADLGLGQEASVLVVSLFVLGYAFGPMIWAPVSEVYGRRMSMVPAFFVLGLFSVGTAVSRSPAAVFVTRFFGGVFASSAISNVGAAVGDIYSPRDRGIPIAIYAVCVVGGPCIGPVIGAAIVVNPALGWRWTEWVLAILSFASAALNLLCLRETFHPVLLRRRAERRRRDTGDGGWWHPHELERFSPANVLTKYVSRPLRMLLTEPMMACICGYASFIYGIVFFQLEAFPVVFAEQRRYSTVVACLPFLGLFVGVLCALPINILNQPLYARAVARNRGRPVPEARLPPMMVGAALLTVGIFWFGWTAAPSFHWALPTVAGGFIGAGFNIAFQQCLNFLADTYGPFTASAMAGNTFLRSLLACGLPLAARPLFYNLGIGPGCSILGAISCLSLPFPFIFMRYGLKLRQMSKFAPVPKD